MVLPSDASLVRLPSALSDAVNDGVRAFVDDYKDRVLKAYYRWHDADLWMVYQEKANSWGEKGEPAICQQRVTIGAFAGEDGFEPEIVFTPDVLVITPEGRYVMDPKDRANAQKVIHLADYLSKPAELKKNVTKELESAWQTALRLNPDEAKVFLP